MGEEEKNLESENFERRAVNDYEGNVIAKTFFWMFLGLLGTALLAWYTYSSGMMIDFIMNGTWQALLIGEVVVVLLFSLLFRKLPATVVGILYFIYAFINGVTLSTIFYIFELNSIIYLFIASALVFGILAFIGYKTESDISNWRKILSTFLIIGIVLSLINLFLKNSMLDIALDWFILLTFFGVTIYDMNKIKNLGYEGLDTSKIHIYGAMQLYLDFINIFLRILSIFGKRKN